RERGAGGSRVRAARGTAALPGWLAGLHRRAIRVHGLLAGQAGRGAGGIGDDVHGGRQRGDPAPAHGQVADPRADRKAGRVSIAGDAHPMSAEWDNAAADLCAWAQQEGMAAFVLRTTDSGDVRLVGLRLPPEMVAKMLRAAASGYEAQVSPETLN